MNDDLLTRFRKAPRHEFAVRLYQRINTPMNKQRNLMFRRLAFAAAVCMTLVAAFAFLPVVRAEFNSLIQEIGGVTYLGPEETVSQVTETPAEEVTVPEEIVTFTEAREKLPYEIRLPAWAPDGYVMGSAVQIAYFPGDYTPAYLTWYGTDAGGAINLTIGQSVSWLVDMDHIEEVQVNGQPAALLRGNWSADTGGWETTYGDLTLTWKLDDVMYRLSSASLTTEELIRMAESIQ